jgi:hypothetical protein
MMRYYLIVGSAVRPETKERKMTKFNVFHCEHDRGVRNVYYVANRQAGSVCREEGPVDGFETKVAAETELERMQSEARAAGHPEYAEQLCVMQCDEK